MANSQQPLVIRVATGRAANGEYQSLKKLTGILEFAAARDKFIQDNRKLAEGMQELVVGEVQRGIKRRNVSTGRLLSATRDAQNRYADAQTWGVGVPRFLDKSQAKYWRTIEEGSAAVWKHPFAGMEFFVPRGQAFGGTIAGFTNDRSFAGPPFTKAGANRKGKLNALSSTLVGRLESEKGRRPRWITVVTIHNEIQGQNAYDQAFRAFGGFQAVKRVYTNKFDRAFRGY